MLTLLLVLQQPIAPEPLVQKGIEHLKSRAADLQKDPEFALWTLLTAGVEQTDPIVQKLLQGLLDRPPESTRSAALQAMILQKIDLVNHRGRIAHCAQLLLDNQCADGRWEKGRAVPPLDPPPPKPKVTNVPLPVVSRFDVFRRSEGPQEGETVSSRWAAWGLLACSQAGIRFADDFPPKAAAPWRTGDHDPADVVACLSIYRHLQNKDWRTDPDTLKAIEGLQVEDRVNDPGRMFLLKRAMFLYNSSTLGGKEWWSQGVKLLAAAQSPDGSWGGVEETCWAVVYLHVDRKPWPVPIPR